MRTVMIFATAALLSLAGCGTLDNQPSQPPQAPVAKWKPSFRLALDTKQPTPHPAGVTLPVISYTTDPKATERRAALVVKFDASGVKNVQPGKDRFIMSAVDLSAAGGTLPANYLDLAEQKLAKQFGAYCMKGTVKVSMALVRSSIKPEANEAEINAKLLSDWLAAEVEFKNPNRHPKC